MDSVPALTPGMSGRWLVTTQGSRHVWDLDARTYLRFPGAVSLSGPFPFDGDALTITHIHRWPQVGCTSLIWLEDPSQSIAKSHDIRDFRTEVVYQGDDVVKIWSLVET